MQKGVIRITDEDTFRDAVSEIPRGESARVPVEVRVGIEDPYRAYLRTRNGSSGFFLETTGGQEGWGYFSPEPAERIEANAGAVVREDVDAEHGDFANTSPSLNALGGVLDGERLVRGECDVPYPCGLFGWLSYDIVRELEELPDTTVDDLGLPRLQFGLYDCLAAWEEPSSAPVTLRVTCCPDVSHDTDVHAAYTRALDRAKQFADGAVNGSVTHSTTESTDDRMEFNSNITEAEYADRVRAVLDYIYEGDTFQANISQCLTAPGTIEPSDIYEALREINPAPYSGLLEFPGVDLVSASPELLLRARDDTLETEPIAGTRPRGETEEEDQRYERDLLGDEKETAEHAMLVDLERNDVGKVSEYGSVTVDEYRRIDRYSEVMHTVSLVTGTLRDDASLIDSTAAVFPGGTITGAPKPRTMEIIDEVESTRRGPYTGSIGMFGFDQRCTLNMTIRTLIRTNDTYYLRVGGGIVHDSEPEPEHKETLDKARALIHALDEAAETRLVVTGGQ